MTKKQVRRAYIKFRNANGHLSRLAALEGFRNLLKNK